MAQVTLVDVTENAEEKIGRYAAICYDSDTSKEACMRRAKSCCDKGHLATLRFAHACFRIEGISRACSHQLVRSKHLDYLQESQRYVLQNDVICVEPQYRDDNLYRDAYATAYYYYTKLIEAGVKKEDARYVLPTAATTKLYVTGNFQAWQDFIKLRTDKAAQWEIRKVAQLIQQELSKVAPTIFGETNGS